MYLFDKVAPGPGSYAWDKYFDRGNKDKKEKKGI